MKSSILSLAAAFGLVAALVASPVLAGPGHGPQHGGVAREVKGVSYELVAKPDSLTLHVSDHGKPISTEGATAEAMIYAGNDRTPVKLAPAGENRMMATGNFRVGVGVRVVLTTTLRGKPPAKATFNLK
jgi:hypothetical protein